MTNELDLVNTAVEQATKVWTKQLGNYASTVFGPASEEFALLLAQEVKLWKAMNLMKHAERLEAVLKERGFDPSMARHLGYAEVVPLIEAASYEESDEVQDLWAKLLASALDPNSGVKIEKVFVSLLKEIGPAEAKLLTLIHKYGGTGTVQLASNDAASAIAEEIEREWRSQFSESVRRSAVQNLRRLGCVAPHVEPPDLYGLLVRLPLDGYARHDVAGIDTRKFERFLKWLVEQAQGGTSSDQLPKVYFQRMIGAERGPDISEALLVLTALGRRLMEAVENVPLEASGDV